MRSSPLRTPAAADAPGAGSRRETVALGTPVGYDSAVARSRFVRVPSILAPFVEHIWFYESEHAHPVETILPSGRMQLLVNLADTVQGMPAAVVTGPATRPVSVDTAAMRRLVGVSFRAGGARPFVRSPCSALRDQDVGLDALDGPNGESLRARLQDVLERCADPEVVLTELVRVLFELNARHRDRLSQDPVVAYMVTALDAGSPVAKAVEATGWSRATVVRRFADAVGLTPKQYASLAQFQRAVALLAEGHDDLVGVAQACGYHDQAHFTRAFSRYAGRTPARYRPRTADEPNHVQP